MKPLLLACALVLSLVQPTTASNHGDSWRMRECRYQSLQPGHWTEREVHKTIHCAITHWPVSHSTADYVAERESGLYWHATNSTSGACGIYQHLPRYWPGRVASFNDAAPRWDLAPSCYNARSNILVAIRMARSGGWSPWSVS